MNERLPTPLAPEAGGRLARAGAAVRDASSKAGLRFDAQVLLTLLADPAPEAA